MISQNTHLRIEAATYRVKGNLNFIVFIALEGVIFFYQCTVCLTIYNRFSQRKSERNFPSTVQLFNDHNLNLKLKPCGTLSGVIPLFTQLMNNKNFNKFGIHVLKNARDKKLPRASVPRQNQIITFPRIFCFC